ncbi:Thiol:disulfide interchange protein DsbD precursor [Neorhodopirellula pilleata]|uniref:Thiol:disulfide interchange protein DsbD n=2 Tax=Neorhodopirellula pilleata TaxID=2714738 RepID=A0A5C6ACZ1_9BACT|nr:Thiol:disulfide interchange protein DsbD precursor [Neorhodopirellula pilleata]
MFMPVAMLTAQGPADLFPDLSLGKYGQPATGVETPDEPAKWSATYKTIDAGAGMFVIEVRAEMNAPWHVYSLTQPKGGPSPTKLNLVSPDSIELLGPWQADREPTKSISKEFGGITIEEFGDEVVFSAPAWLKTPGDAIDDIGEIKIAIDALACVSGGSCMPIEETLVAQYGGALEPKEAMAARATVSERVESETQPQPEDSQPETAEQDDRLIAEFANDLPLFRDEDYSVQWKAWITDSTLLPGQQTQLNFSAIPDETYHVYPAVVDDSPKATNFAISDKSGLRIGPPTTDAEILTEEPVPGLINVYHTGPVTWSMPIEVPADAQPGVKTIRGLLAYQACTDQSCLMPMGASFESTIEILPSDTPESKAGSTPTAVTLTSAKFRDTMKLAKGGAWVDKIAPPQAATDQLAAGGPPNDSKEVDPINAESIVADGGEVIEEATSFPLTLAFAFLGGIILNFMPCVLPVVGLKVMSFVQQAGENRSRVLMLNLVYALGILSVFALLAGLAVGLSFSWGEQFTYFEFRLGLTLLMFALALSYLGVWEIPAPSFASGKASQKLGAKEGYVGAFFKGVFATLMATPCSGPLLGYILGATITLSPVQTVVIMMTVGVGMALPYLIIGARPSLVSWLPKPGPWMETLKEFLAFLFLGTVAFFFYGFTDETKVAVFVTLIGVWFGCWVIGKVPAWQTIQRRLAAWAVGLSAATAIGMWSFTALVPGEEIIRWQPYSEAKLDALLADGKTVVLDFTADWCVNCKVNEKFALNTEPTAELLEQFDAIPMVADWSDRDNPEIKEKLSELQSRSIPVLAIYPGSQPDKPIILRDLVSQQMVLDAIKEAGPSQSPGQPRVASFGK